MRITLPIYYTIKYKTKKDKTILIGMNWLRNAHYMLSNKIKKHYHHLVAEQVKNTRYTQITIEYKVFIKRKNTDYHNIRSVIEKFFLDALVENGNIKDDSFDYVKGDSCEVFIDKEDPRIEILIINK